MAQVNTGCSFSKG